MDTAFTEEQDDIRRTVRELLAKHCGPDEVRSAVNTAAGYDEALWQRLGPALPRQHNGANCGTAELAPVFEETGRVLMPSPLTAVAALSAPLVQELGTAEQRARLLPEMASGALTAALAVPGEALPYVLGLTGADGAADPGAWAGGGRSGGVQARSTDDGWRLYGEARQILAGHSARLLLIAAHVGGYTRSRVLFFLVTDGAEGLVRTRQPGTDETRPAARIELRDTPAEMLGGDDGTDIAAALTRTGSHAAALLAAEAAGAAAGALARTAGHLRNGERPGHPAGSLQRRLADVYVQVQAARSAAYCAARETGGARPGGPAPVCGGLALAQALEAQRLAAGESVHLHAGTDGEHDAHLYFRRAAGDELLFGPVHGLRTHAAIRAGLSPEVA